MSAAIWRAWHVARGHNVITWGDDSGGWGYFCCACDTDVEVGARRDLD